MDVGSSHVNIEDASNREAHMTEQMKAKDKTIKFLRTFVAYWRNRALAAGSEHCAHDLELLQKTMEVDSSRVSVEDASKREAHMMEQMKAKDETIEFLRTSVACWHNRALAGEHKNLHAPASKDLQG